MKEKLYILYVRRYNRVTNTILLLLLRCTCNMNTKQQQLTNFCKVVSVSL